MEENTDLNKYYKYVYICECGREYGSDKVERDEHVCPICLDKKEEQINQFPAAICLEKKEK